LNYENGTVKCRALRHIPCIETVGFKLEEVPPNREFTTYYWVARELMKNGLIEYLDGLLNNNEWIQIHFKERINPAGPPNPLPDGFYAKVYRTFTSAEHLDTKVNINRMMAQYRDILESRINKIARQAVSEAHSSTRVLQPEESYLYERIHQIVSDWRNKMRKIGGSQI